MGDTRLGLGMVSVSQTLWLVVSATWKPWQWAATGRLDDRWGRREEGGSPSKLGTSPSTKVVGEAPPTPLLYSLCVVG